MILIVGCGFLGQYVLKELILKTDERIVCTYNCEKPVLKFKTPDSVAFIKCDVTDFKDLSELNEYCGDEEKTVFYFAASHNIDFVFKNSGEAGKVNIEGLKQFLKTVHNIKFLYFASTDCVYGESKPGEAPFKETDRCEPVNEYGRQKLEAESIVLEHGFNVFRFSLLYGASLCKKKTFYDRIIFSLKHGDSVEMIEGLSRNALHYKEASEIILKLVSQSKIIPSIVNISGDKQLNKYQLGLLIADISSANPAQIKKINIQEAEGFFEDKRADSILLDNTLMKSLTEE